MDKTTKTQRATGYMLLMKTGLTKRSTWCFSARPTNEKVGRRFQRETFPKEVIEINWRKKAHQSQPIRTIMKYILLLSLINAASSRVAQQSARNMAAVAWKTCAGTPCSEFYDESQDCYSDKNRGVLCPEEECVNNCFWAPSQINFCYNFLEETCNSTKKCTLDSDCDDNELCKNEFSFECGPRYVKRKFYST